MSEIDANMDLVARTDDAERKRWAAVLAPKEAPAQAPRAQTAIKTVAPDMKDKLLNLAQWLALTAVFICALAATVGVSVL